MLRGETTASPSNDEELIVAANTKSEKQSVDGRIQSVCLYVDMGVVVRGRIAACSMLLSFC